MVELGDLREGILPYDLPQFIRETLSMPNIKIIGIGCNLACLGGIKPNDTNMRELSELVGLVEKEFHIDLEIISGGNSANFKWFKSTKDIERINNLRLGESILLGCETLSRKIILGLHTGAFQLIAEVIESKRKMSVPIGNIYQDAFGNVPKFIDQGDHQRVIIALGRQDVQTSNLKSNSKLRMIGSSSDHIVLDGENHNLKVGDEIRFSLDYSGILATMTSPFVIKQFTDSNAHLAA